MNFSHLYNMYGMFYKVEKIKSQNDEIWRTGLTMPLKSLLRFFCFISYPLHIRNFEIETVRVERRKIIKELLVAKLLY